MVEVENVISLNDILDEIWSIFERVSHFTVDMIKPHPNHNPLQTYDCRCFEPDPEKRGSAAELLEHQFLSE